MKINKNKNKNSSCGATTREDHEIFMFVEYLANHDRGHRRTTMVNTGFVHSLSCE
jgi:hypothetical protein